MKAQVLHSGNHDDADYDQFLARVNDRFIANTNNGKDPVFTTDAEGLFEAYLSAFHEGSVRQHHTCHACRQFIERFGGLVTIDHKGMTKPAIWNEDDAPEHYKAAVAAMAKLVRKAKVTGVFLSSEHTWGQPSTGDWHHFFVKPPSSMVFRRGVLTAGQKMAEKREDFKTMIRAMSEFDENVIDTAITLLRTDSLYRSEKVLGQAEWLKLVHADRAAARGSNKNNLLWRSVAIAPAGFCHPRSSMIGSLLEDIEAGMSYDMVARRFADKMHPLQYQRPQAAPSSGSIAQAEKLVQQMGIERSLPRRFARLDEVQAIWKPAPVNVEAKGGVFGHLKPKGSAPSASDMRIPPTTMTWEKFQRTVLPDAEQIEIYANHGTDSYTSLVTAVNADAPPILQWDHEDQRNPVSWYFWHGGATAAQFGLTAGQFHKVAAIAFKPSMWVGGCEHHGLGVVLLVAGAKDSRTPSACLFPEILKSELHGVRSVIEAYSREAKMEDTDGPLAAGVMLQKGATWNTLLRVTSGNTPIEYKLDRWD